MAGDLNTIYRLLQEALSQEEATRKPAEASLSSFESLPGFCSCLLEIIGTRDLQNDARWLATVYFKNSIDRYWRTRREPADARRGITDAEKPYLRKKLLQLIREENHQVAIQLAILISKIARIDFPRDWQELFPTLLQILQSSDMLTTQRVYMVLHQILKQLASKRLAVDQQNLIAVTSQLFGLAWGQWCSDTQTVINEFSACISSPDRFLSSSQNQALPLMLERWALCLKVVSGMLRFGFQSDEKSVQEVPPVKDVCPAILQTIQSFLQYRAVFPPDHLIYSFTQKASVKLMKTLVAIQSVHPYSFSNESVLPAVLQYVWRQILEENNLFEQFIMQCMELVQRVLQCQAYKQIKLGRVLGESTPSMEQTKGKLSSKAEAMINALLDEKRILQLCDVLVRRYFVYTAKDLEEWAHDPELFHHELAQGRDRLRPHAEALYLTLFENHKEVLAPYIVELLNQVSQACPPPAPEADVQLTSAFLAKEAVYNAVGLASYNLSDYFDFKRWFEGALARELMNAHSNNRILRYRIACLIGQWVGKIVKELRRLTHVVLLRLLGDSDPAVQLAACHSLQTVIDDVDFYEEDFVELIPSCLDLLFEFMQHAQEFDSKLQIFYVVSLIIDRLAEKIAPCTQKIMAFLPQVWQSSAGQSLLKIEVLLALQRLVTALGPRSPTSYSLLLPILQHVTDVNQPDELNLLEDGMQLWRTTLKHAPVMIPELLAIFPHAVSVLDRSLEHFQVCMDIVESYSLLSGTEFLARHGRGILAIFKTVIGNVKEKGTLNALSVLDTLIQCFPLDAPPLMEEVMQTLFVMVISSPDESDLVKASAGAILARVLVQNSSYFVHLSSQPLLLHKLHQAGVTVNCSPVILFFDSWLEKVDSLLSSSKRKVCGLALCILLSSSEPLILERLEQILSVCTSILEDEKAGGCNSDYMNAPPPPPPSLQNQESRKQQIENCDPVNKLPLAPLLKEKLETCAALHGQAAFNGALSRLHPKLLTQLQQL